MTDEPGFWQRRYMDERDRLAEERDRRYAENRAADQRALTILQTSQEAALELARSAQLYRDEQANKLRDQINSERNLYATKSDLDNAEDKMAALIRPALEAMSERRGSQITRGTLVTVVGVALALMTLVLSVVVAVANAVTG